MKFKSKFLALMLSVVMALAMAVPAYAEDITPGQEQTTTYTYSAPTEPMAIDDNIVTATAHRAATPVLGILGVNAVGGFGMWNGGAPADLAAAEKTAALGIWGSSLNSNPDPYVWNYFYNYYAEANDLETTEDALSNDNVAGSPVMADKNLKAQYGNISSSLARRPDVAIGCSATAAGTDVTGYDDQLATIHSFSTDSEYYQEGDETYSPKLVSYQTKTLANMIQSMKDAAAAIYEVEQETGKTTRYGDVNTIANDYETFVYGLIAYVNGELDAKGLPQKTFAYVAGKNDDGTYAVGTCYKVSATSNCRAIEYCDTVATNIVSKEEADEAGQAATINISEDRLFDADVIILIDNTNVDVDLSNYDGIVIKNTPSALYGVTMNSVENANGLAYVLSCMYSDILDIDPVESCAYFYEHFLHITDFASLQKVVLTNFASTTLPAGCEKTLSADYSSAAFEAKLIKGMIYFSHNSSVFSTDQYSNCGIANWVPNYEDGIGAGAAPVSGHIYDIEWTWAADKSSATANFACEVCGHSGSATADSYVDGNKLTTTVCFEGENYSDSVLAAPTKPVISSVKNKTNGIVITWKANSATGLFLYRSVNGGAYTRIATIKDGSTTYTDTKATTNGAKYAYKLVAFNKIDGLGSLTTKGSAKYIYRLGNPTVSISKTSSYVKTTWDKITGASGYYVYRSVNGGSYQKVYTTTSRYYKDANVKSGKKYAYKIVAYYNEKSSGTSFVGAYSSAKAITFTK